MENSKTRTAEHAQIVNNLSFFKEPNWKDQLLAQVNSEETDGTYSSHLVAAGPGIGDCMDERRSLTQEQISNLGLQSVMCSHDIVNPKPSMVGGAGGWVFYFMLQGKILPDAVDCTKKLYESLGWGRMQTHIDDEHGETTQGEELKKREVGCGFLKVASEVVQILKELGIIQTNVQVNGVEIFNALKNDGAEVVPLTGKHKLREASVVINQREKFTYPKDMQYNTLPAFVWDSWQTVNPVVLNEFNRLAGSQMDLGGFDKLQTSTHLVTGMLLEAVRLPTGGQQGNVVLTR